MRGLKGIKRTKRTEKTEVVYKGMRRKGWDWNGQKWRKIKRAKMNSLLIVLKYYSYMIQQKPKWIQKIYIQFFSNEYFKTLGVIATKSVTPLSLSWNTPLHLYEHHFVKPVFYFKCKPLTLCDRVVIVVHLYNHNWTLQLCKIIL